MMCCASASVEASEWYLRAAVGVERSEDADFSDRDCASQQPAALFGCVQGDDGKPIGAYGDFGDYPVLEVAFGRQILPWLRADLSVGYRFEADYRGNANFLSVGTDEPVSADLESWNGVVNAFVDIAPLTGQDLGRLSTISGRESGYLSEPLGSTRAGSWPRRWRVA